MSNSALEVSKLNGSKVKSYSPLLNRSRGFSTSSNVSSSNSSNANISRNLNLSVARRPSDNYLSASMDPDLQPPASGRLFGKRDRPISNDSVNSRNAELFSALSSTETISEATSNEDDEVEEQLETAQNQSASLCNLSKDSGLFDKNGSVLNRSHYPTPIYLKYDSSTKSLPRSDSVLLLTSSQKFKKRREKSELSLRKSISMKEKLYDEQNYNDSLIEDDLDDSMIWNVPMASVSTTSFLTRKKSVKTNNNHNDPPPPVPNVLAPSSLDFYKMPVTPIPGINSTPDFQFIEETSSSLSSLYLHSSDKLSKKKVTTRSDSFNSLPTELRDASKSGMEDLLLVSEDKLKMISNSRPSWLPPKSVSEMAHHDKEIFQKLNHASIGQLNLTTKINRNIKINLNNTERYRTLIKQGISKKSSVELLRKRIWETALPVDLRLTAWKQLLDCDGYICGTRIEPYEELNKTLQKMTVLMTKRSEMTKLVCKNIKNKLGGKYKIHKDLLHILEIKSISRQGLLTGDELLIHHLLINYPNTPINEIWEVLNLLQITCFNDMTKEKYDAQMMNPNGVVYSHIAKNKDFQNEYKIQCLNFNSWWNIMERIDHNLFVWILDIIVVRNSQTPFKLERGLQTPWEEYKSEHIVVNYKILLSFTLKVLLNHHFGFSDLASLSRLEDPDFCIPIKSKTEAEENYTNECFTEKWRTYYQKF